MYKTLDEKRDLAADIERHLAPLVKRIEALEAGQPQSPTGPKEMWAMLYLHDWDPPKEGQEHRWEPGKNVFPEIHNVYDTMREANEVLSRMSDPKKYWVRRVWMPAHDAPAHSRPDGNSK